MINIDHVRKQDLRPINARMSKEQISAMEKEVNHFASRLVCERKLAEKTTLERRAQLADKFHFWK